MKVGDCTREEIREALAGKRGKESLATAKELAAQLDLSVGHIYRLSHGARLNGRAHRCDRGEKRIELSPEIETFMRGLTRQADFSADHAIWVTARHFGLDEHFISTTTYNEWLRRERISRRLLKQDLRPYRSWEASAANSLHQYDTTVAEAFYANDDGSIGNEPGYQRYKNKPGNRRPRLVLYSLIDDFSRVIFARFYFSENTLNLLDFVFGAWAEKNDTRFPFFGIPESLYCDQGSPAKSAKFKHAEEKLGFHMLDTTPSHATEFGSRKHGKVERTFGEGLLGEFMKITRIFRFAHIEELNSGLFEWLIHLNNRPSSTTREIRFARWLRTAGTPRCMPAPELFKILHYDVARPTVTNNLQFSLNGKTFQLPYRKPFVGWAKAKIEAYWYPGHEDVVTVVYDFHEEEIKALAPVIDIALDYKRVETTDREKRLEELKAVNYSKVNFPAIYTPEKDLPYLPRKGEAFDEKKIAEKQTGEGQDGGAKWSFAPMRYLAKFEAVRELRAAGVIVNSPISPAEKAWLDGLFVENEKISEDDLRSEISNLKSRPEGELAEG